jgi:hypothetical protein
MNDKALTSSSFSLWQSKVMATATATKPIDPKETKTTTTTTNKPIIKSEHQCFVLQRAKCVVDHWSKKTPTIDLGFGSEKRNQTALRVMAVWEHLKCTQLEEMVATTGFFLKESFLKFCASEYLTNYLPNREVVDYYEKYSLEELYEDGMVSQRLALRFAELKTTTENNNSNKKATGSNRRQQRRLNAKATKNARCEAACAAAKAKSIAAAAVVSDNKTKS